MTESTIDVILSVLNERDAIPVVLASLPSRFRPIVVDNGSTDGSGDVACALGADVVREPRLGSGAAVPRGSVEQGDADLVLGARHPSTRRAWGHGMGVSATALSHGAAPPHGDLAP